MVDESNKGGTPSGVDMMHSVAFIAGNIFAQNPTMKYEDAVEHAWRIYTAAYTKGIPHLENFNKQITEVAATWGASDGTKN